MLWCGGLWEFWRGQTMPRKAPESADCVCCVRHKLRPGSLPWLLSEGLERQGPPFQSWASLPWARGTWLAQEMSSGTQGLRNPMGAQVPDSSELWTFLVFLIIFSCWVTAWEGAAVHLPMGNPLTDIDLHYRCRQGHLEIGLSQSAQAACPPSQGASGAKCHSEGWSEQIPDPVCFGVWMQYCLWTGS